MKQIQCPVLILHVDVIPTRSCAAPATLSEVLPEGYGGPINNGQDSINNGQDSITFGEFKFGNIIIIQILKKVSISMDLSC